MDRTYIEIEAEEYARDILGDEFETNPDAAESIMTDFIAGAQWYELVVATKN